jgi:septal ring factor EnvC (AmiA/AmiB activator)
MKSKILIISVTLALGCLVVAIISGKTIGESGKMLDIERYNRIVAEEKLDKAMQKIQSLENSVASAQNQLQSIQAVLEQEKVTNDNLKNELEKTEKLKIILEQELKNALVAPPQESPEGQP